MFVARSNGRKEKRRERSTRGVKKERKKRGKKRRKCVQKYQKTLSIFEINLVRPPPKEGALSRTRTSYSFHSSHLSHSFSTILLLLHPSPVFLPSLFF